MATECNSDRIPSTRSAGPAGGKGNGTKEFTFSPANCLVMYFPVSRRISGSAFFFQQLDK
jgi:hypothetical protein